MIYTKGARVRACTSYTYCRGGQRERTGPINQAQPPRFCACARVCENGGGGATAGSAARWISRDSFWCVFRKSISVMNGPDRWYATAPLYVIRYTILILLFYCMTVYVCVCVCVCVYYSRRWTFRVKLRLMTHGNARKSRIPLKINK